MKFYILLIVNNSHKNKQKKQLSFLCLTLSFGLIGEKTFWRSIGREEAELQTENSLKNIVKTSPPLVLNQICWQQVHIKSHPLITSWCEMMGVESSHTLFLCVLKKKKKKKKGWREWPHVLKKEKLQMYRRHFYVDEVGRWLSSSVSPASVCTVK